MPDWTYVPDKGFSKSSQPRVRETRFGDGYSQRSQDGINYMNESYDLQFSNRSFTTLSAMKTFLEGKGGVVAFTFAPPGEAEIKVICKDWNVSTLYHTGTNATSIGSLSARFERVYE